MTCLWEDFVSRAEQSWWWRVASVWHRFESADFFSLLLIIYNFIYHILQNRRRYICEYIINSESKLSARTLEYNEEFSSIILRNAPSK